MRERRNEPVPEIELAQVVADTSPITPCHHSPRYSVSISIAALSHTALPRASGIVRRASSQRFHQTPYRTLQPTKHSAQV